MTKLSHNDHVTFELEGIFLTGVVSAGGNIGYFDHGRLTHVDIADVRNVVCIGTANSRVDIQTIINNLGDL